LRAVAALRDRGIAAELAIAGHGSHEPILRSLAKELRIDQQIRLFQTLAQDELARLLRISDTFAIMSTSETQSMVLLQAMASGLPVVAADTRALPEFVTPANGLLVDPHDVTQLTQALADLLASPARRRALGAAGRQCVEQYRVETITDAWEALYRSVLHGSSAA
jgi:glycosyltransferase involved in cell wall biosynthesis